MRSCLGPLFLLPVLWLWANGASAAPPLFSDGALGAFSADNATGPVVFDTDAGTYTIPGVGTFKGGKVVVQGAGHIAIMTFHFTTFTVPAGKRVTARGARGLALLARGAVQIDGVVDVSGTSSAGMADLAGGPGGPGGGGGGAGGEGADLGFHAVGGIGGLGEGGSGNARARSTAFDGSYGVAPGGGGVFGTGGRGGGGVGPGQHAGQDYGGGGGGGGPGGGAGGAWGNGGGFGGGDGIACGGGGGFGSAGGSGTRVRDVGAATPGGQPYGDETLRFLDGGSGGGGGGDGNDTRNSSHGGGGGGGAVLISSLESIAIGAGGVVRADGGSGGSSSWAGGGGGSGGAILLDAPKIANGGLLSVAGGTGGSSSYGSRAGNGGGGRVALYGDMIEQGTVNTGGGSLKTLPFNGRCAVAIDCDDKNPCTLDGCDPNQGCLHANVADGTPCDDGDACTLGESCREGACGSPTSRVDCRARDECHLAGLCSPQSGTCTNPPNPDACRSGEGPGDPGPMGMDMRGGSPGHLTGGGLGCQLGAGTGGGFGLGLLALALLVSARLQRRPSPPQRLVRGPK